MTSDYIIALIELSLNVGNDEYIVQCNFAGHSTSGVEVIEGGRLEPPPPPSPGSQEAKNSTVWIGLNENNKNENTFWKIHCLKGLSVIHFVELKRKKERKI